MEATRSRYGIVAELEHRPDHHGEVSTVIHPTNGTLICTTDAGLDNVFVCAVYHLLAGDAS